MSFFKLLWVFLIAWVGSCGYYCWRINRLVRGSGFSLFVSPARLSKTTRIIIKKLLINILIATILFLLAIISAYFVSTSS